MKADPFSAAIYVFLAKRTAMLRAIHAREDSVWLNHRRALDGAPSMVADSARPAAGRCARSSDAQRWKSPEVKSWTPVNTIVISAVAALPSVSTRTVVLTPPVCSQVTLLATTLDVGAATNANA